MPATEMTVTAAGRIGDKDLLIPTGVYGTVYPHVQDWVASRLKAKVTLKDVSGAVLVKGIKQWVAYDEKKGATTRRIVFKIT